jgi:hypothetical protein
VAGAKEAIFSLGPLPGMVQCLGTARFRSKPPHGAQVHPQSPVFASGTRNPTGNDVGLAGSTVTRNENP